MLFDIIFMLVLFGAVTLGFFRGITPIVILIIMFYLSNVLASLYFPALGLFIEQRYATAPDIARYASFLFVLLISFFALSAGGIYTFRHAKMPKRLEQFDRVAGVLLSLALAFIITTIFTFLLWNVSRVTEENEAQETTLNNVVDRTNQSFIVDYFALNVLPGVRHVIVPILPDSAQMIFAPEETIPSTNQW